MTPFIDSILEPFVWFLTDWSLRWAVLIGLLAACLLIFRPRRASTRSLLCWVILLAGLLLPALPRWGPGFASPAPAVQARSPEGEPMESPPMPEVEEIVAIPAKADETNKVPQARPPGSRAWQGPTFPQKLVGQHPTEETRSVEDSQSPPLDSEPWGIRRIVIFTLAGLWACGVLLLLIRWLGGLVLLGRLRRAALPVQGAAGQIFEACRRELGLRRRVFLATHPAVHSPVTLGLFRPTILVPADWHNQPEATQRGALLHELAHLARYDDWSALLLELTRVFFFFHPLVYWLLVRLERERELLCDEAAVSRGIDRQDYARMLLEFSRQAGRLRPTALISPSYPIRFGNRRTVKIRIHQLLEETMHLSKSPLSLRGAALVGVSVLALALIMGSFRVRAIEPEAVPDKEEPAKPQVTAEETKKITPEVFRIEPFHILKIRAVRTLPDEPISGNFLVEPEGKVDLGPSYGKVSVKGLTLEEAAGEVLQHLRRFLKDPKVSVTLAGWTTKWKDDSEKKTPFRIKPFHLLNIRAIGTPPDQPISGPHLVEPSGKVDLGPTYGKVAVKGLTLEEAAAEVLQHLRRFLKDPKVSVTLAGWENDWHDLEKDGAGPPTKTPAKSGSKKEALRYDKKSFEEWRSILVTELKPESRIEAIKALRAFGTNGYGEEVTAVMLALIKSYGDSGVDEDNSKVIGDCIASIRWFGSPAIKVLLTELKHGNKQDRLTALDVLGRINANNEVATAAIMAAMKDQDPDIRIAAINVLPLASSDDKSSFAALLQAINDSDPRVSRNAIEYVGNWQNGLERIRKKIAPNVNALVPALITALKDTDPRHAATSIDLERRAAVTILGEMGPPAKSAVPTLAELLKEEDYSFRLDVIKTLRKIGADPKLMVPALAEILTADKRLGDFRKEVIEILGEIGPEAKDAVPALTKVLKEDKSFAMDIVHTLGSIGPGAKEAVPALTELLQSRNPELEKATARALEKIAK